MWLFWLKYHVFVKIDPPLILLLSLMTLLGGICLFSASGQNWHVLYKHVCRLCFGMTLLLCFAHLPPRLLRAFAPHCYGMANLLLGAVLIMGFIGKGAQRWFNLGLFHVQPSEFLKIILPMMLAWYLHHRPLPPKLKHVFQLLGLVAVPFLLICKQPDLGTAMMLLFVSASLVILAGLNHKILLSSMVGAIMMCPILWHFMHAYQKNRIFTFFNPERDPLGTGYHIIQSKIAVGSGGLWGKGWLHGTQSHLNFLPEHTTDFIFAVMAEEFGLMGCMVLMLLILAITARIFYISMHANDTFNRLLSGSLGILFFLSCVTNMAMVLGLLPIVGIPLPLISYGGSNLMTTMISFGIIMSVHAHKRLIDA